LVILEFLNAKFQETDSFPDMKNYKDPLTALRTFSKPIKLVLVYSMPLEKKVDLL
jgi:hypothetical protein